MSAGDKVFWSAAEAAAELGISVKHLDREKNAGRIACDQRGRGCRVRYRREHLDAYATGRDALVDQLAERRGQPLRPTADSTSPRRPRRP